MQHQDLDKVSSDYVDSLFEDDEALSYNCSSCNCSLKLSECYPEKSRQTLKPQQSKKSRQTLKPQKSQLFCKKCFETNNAILDSVGLKKAKSSASSKVTKKAKKPKSKSSASKFQVFDYVMAQYPGYGKKWFKAEIYAKYRGKYHLYFLEDNSTLLHVEEKALKKVVKQQAWTKLKRVDFLKKPFDKKNEKWHAVKVGKGYRSNKYGCKIIGKAASEKLVWLPVSEVQQLIRSSS